MDPVLVTITLRPLSDEIPFEEWRLDAEQAVKSWCSLMSQSDNTLSFRPIIVKRELMIDAEFSERPDAVFFKLAWSKTEL